MPNCKNSLLSESSWRGKAFRLIFISILLAGNVFAQKFSGVSGANFPFVSNGPPSYTGASFIDYDQDGDLDIFIGLKGLYRNDSGAFVLVSGSGIKTSTGLGNSWADADNDGDVDLFIAGGNSFYYRNNGDDTFTKIRSGATADSFALRGWSCAWGDFNNDGNVDLTITHPAGFIAPGNQPTLNHILVNDGPANSYSLTQLDATLVSNGFQPYTIGTWSDFDQDGDVDYFVGAGPANGSTARDFLYRNLFIETGSIGFERIQDNPIGTDTQDGQVWNWIDYDNDGDFDAYLTNWVGATNRLYRNDDGVFTRINGVSMVTDPGASLASIWADYDNDGDLDAYVGNDNGTTDRYYRNNGDGSFTRVDTLVFIGTSTRRSGSAGDFDDDGDIDLLLSGPGIAMKLYRNISNFGNHWINITCTGTRSNRSALGTKVRAKAIINGNPVWQLREISAQNSFNAQNDLRVHFGLGDATTIDSLRFEWPSGIVQVQTNVTADQFLTVTEDSTIVAITPPDGTVPGRFELAQNFPNPFNPSTTIQYSLPQNGFVTLQIFNLLGQEVKTLVSSMQPAGLQSVVWNSTNNAGNTVASGIYIYRLTAGDPSTSSGPSFSQTRKMVLIH